MAEKKEVMRQFQVEVGEDERDDYGKMVQKWFKVIVEAPDALEAIKKVVADPEGVPRDFEVVTVRRLVSSSKPPPQHSAQ